MRYCPVCGFKKAWGCERAVAFRGGWCGLMARTWTYLELAR